MPHKTPPTAQRNADILKMRQAGLTLRKIANNHNLAPWTVLQIVRREESKDEWAKRSGRLRRECQENKDFTRVMPIEDLFCLLEYPTIIRTALGRYFHREGIQVYSYLNMMEFLIPKVRSSNVRYGVMPACVLTGIGIKHYAAMIRGLSLLDCGEEFQKEWADRKNLLKEYLTGTGKKWKALVFHPEVENHSFPLAVTNKKVHILSPKGEEMLLWNAKTSPRFPAHSSPPNCFPSVGTMTRVNDKIFDTHR